MSNKVFDLWKSSRAHHKISKKDFIKQNKKMVANLNNMNKSIFTQIYCHYFHVY